MHCKMTMRLCIKTALCLLLVLCLGLTACAPAGGEASGITTLIYANLTDVEDLGPDREEIDLFNSTHTDVQIEVRNYFNEDGRSGRERLLAEMLAGDIPDIINLGYDPSSYGASLLPYRSLAKKGYLEDLWPYIENDPELGRDAVLAAPLKAAEIDGGLYMAFSSVSLETLVGSASVVGDRYSWTLAELQEAFSAMPEGSVILEHYCTKEMALTILGAMLTDGYVDWDTGKCSFDSEDFRAMLEFMNSFPDDVEVNLDMGGREILAEMSSRLTGGRQLLLHEVGSQPLDLQVADTLFGGHAVCIGYPVADGGTGSYFMPNAGGSRLAISSACKDKDAAWEFVRQLFLPQYDGKTIVDVSVIPINRSDYDKLTAYSCSVRIYEKAPDGNYFAFGLGSPPVKVHPVTAEELARYEDFLDSIDRIGMCDPVIHGVVREAAGAYFAGDKTLDETVELIQNRVQLYVNENR